MLFREGFSSYSQTAVAARENESGVRVHNDALTEAEVVPLGLAEIDHDGLGPKSMTSDGAVKESRQQPNPADNSCGSLEAQPDPQTEHKTHKGNQRIREPLPFAIRSAQDGELPEGRHVDSDVHECDLELRERRVIWPDALTEVHLQTARDACEQTHQHRGEHDVALGIDHIFSQRGDAIEAAVSIMATIAIRMVVTKWPRQSCCAMPKRGIGAMGMVRTMP